MTPYTELRGQPRMDLGQTFPLSLPLTLYVEPTNVCNFKCVMCPQSFDDYQEHAGYYQRMPMGLYSQILREIQCIGRLKSLKLFFQGEPLMNPDLGLMVERAKAACVADRVEVTTNASLLTGQRAEELISSGLDYLRVSVYSIDAEAHKGLTGASRFSPANIAENVGRMKALRDLMGRKNPWIVAQYMHDSKEGEAAFRGAYAPICDEVTVQYRYNWQALVNVEQITTKLYTPDPDGIKREFRHHKDCCPYPFYMMAVKANGEVSTCCLDWEGQLNIGDLRKQTLSEIWHGEKLRSLQRMHLSGQRSKIPACANCDAIFTTVDDVTLSVEEFNRRAVE
jgi:radical SAM protein with 4Fe4S-binding SPASM domain